jgi:hypothetical protein
MLFQLSKEMEVLGCIVQAVWRISNTRQDQQNYSMSCVMIYHVWKSAVKKDHFSYDQAREINPDGSFTSCSAVQYLAQHCLPPEPTPQTQLLGQFHWECLAHHTAQTLHLLTYTFSDNWRTLKRKNSDVMKGKAKRHQWLQMLGLKVFEGTEQSVCQWHKQRVYLLKKCVWHLYWINMSVTHTWMLFINHPSEVWELF